MLLYTIFIIILVLTKEIYSLKCDACLDNICYSKVQLWNKSDGEIYGQLSVDRTSNTLYLNVKKNEEYSTAAINIDTGEISYNDPNATTYFNGRAVDQDTRDHYMYATKPGLTKYNPVTKMTQHLGLYGASAAYFQFKDLLFYAGILYGLCIYFPNDGAQCFTKLRFEEVDEFVIDKYNDFYYRNNAKVKRFNIGKNEIENLFTNRFAHLVVDRELNVYYILFTQVFKLDYEKDEFIEMGGFVDTQVYYAVFDRDNSIVYHDIKSSVAVYKLKANLGSCVFDYNRKIINYYDP